MKTKIVSIALFVGICASLFAQPKVKDVVGAWESGNPESRTTIIFSEGYFASTQYDLTNKKFISTHGGKWKLEGDKLIQVIEFDMKTPEDVGTEIKLEAKLKGKSLQLGSSNYYRVDDGLPGKLAGAWLITGRMGDDGMRTMTPGVRKTMKILSGTRFQWIAYNTETKEFLGTGGGTYTSVDGKYVENIEFFSRDNSRVGASLSFDFSLDDGRWAHKGLSSKGDPIHEIWTRREKLEKP
jgi:hypothetical protein